MVTLTTIILLILTGNVLSAAIDSNNLFRLNIIHYNDFHARYEETSVDSAVCRYNNASCLGGFPRLYRRVRALLRDKPDAVLLNAGDSFQGTYWYSVLKWNITQEFMNLLPHDAHAIGNHEFDDGPEGLVPYLRALKAPVVAANMDTSREPAFEGTYKTSIIVERHGRKIGIIGLITEDTKKFSTPGNVVFTNPFQATKKESEALTKQGVDIIILLSHSGLPVDKQIARVCGRYIDIIVGGHTHSLLWNGEAPTGETVVGSYPMIIESDVDEKHKVLIVQASSFTKYLGNLSVYFDSRGDFVKWDGGPIFLNRDLPEDAEIKKKLEPYARVVHEAENKPVGHSFTSLDSAECSYGECSLGNLLADSLVDYAKQLDSSHHYIAFVHRVNIKSKINSGTITQVDIFDVCPFLDYIFHFEIKGKYIKEVLEAAVSGAKSLSPFEGSNLQQVSGLQVIYNVSQAEGHRVTSVYIGEVASSVLMENDEYYHVLTAKYSVYFGKGFRGVWGHAKNVKVIGRDQTILRTYIEKYTPLDILVNGRIVIHNK